MDCAEYYQHENGPLTLLSAQGCFGLSRNRPIVMGLHIIFLINETTPANPSR